ncbi:MAG: hypothetical protein M3R36_16655 [Bacteroidota bacterium]|nr:hypothetical protein [Bacteroidota bacterium]
MKKNPGKNYIYIIAACLFTYLFYFIFEYIFTDGQMGVPLDDTWIHFQFADNFVKGYFFQFNPGEPAAGTTSPFYVIVLGTTSFLIKNFIVNSIFLSALFFLLSCIFIYKISLSIFKSENSPLKSITSNYISAESISLIVSLLTVFAGRFAWAALSGMETTMFTFFCILGIYFHIKNLQSKKFTLIPALFLSLATVSRPEGFLLFGLYLADVFLNLKKDKVFKKNIFTLAFSILIFLIITFPYLIFSYSITGHFFPNTFRGQGGNLTFIPDFYYLFRAIAYFISDNLIIGLLYIVSVFFYFKNINKYFTDLKYLNLIFLWIILLPLVSSILIPNYRHHLRYLIPLIPFVNIAGMYILMLLFKKNYFLKIKGILFKRKNSLALIILLSFVYYIVFAVALGKNTDNINNQQVKLAGWVSENVGRNETIALNDIGAITFINKNRIIDMAGLVTPELLRYRTYRWEDNLDSINYLLKKNNVSYIIIYDEWFKEYLDKYKDSFTFVTSAYLEDNTICGAKEMKVYKTNFYGKKD